MRIRGSRSTSRKLLRFLILIPFIAAWGPGTSTQGAEDPFRLVQVSEWVGSLKVNGSGSGTVTIGSGSWSYDLQVGIDLPLHLTPTLPGQPINVEWSDCPTRYNATFSNHWSNACPSPLTGSVHGEVSATVLSFEGSNPNQCVTLSVTLGDTGDLEVSLYTSFLHLDGTSRIFNYDCAGRDSDPEAAYIDPIPSQAQELFKLLPIPETGLRINADWSFDDDYQVGIPEVQPIHWQVNVDLSGDPEEVELVVVPLAMAGGAAYQDWRPEGRTDELDPGNQIGFEAKLLKKQDGTFAATPVEKFRFELQDISREPGVCMNWPNETVASSRDELDLKFQPFDHPVPWTPPDDPAVVELRFQEGQWSPESLPAIVTAFDWGAHAKLRVEATLGDGRVVVGHLAEKPDDATIPIPRSTGNSKIADGWKAKNGVTALTDDSDAESQPAGDGDQGDGLTLYEEYRGFYVGEGNDHISGSPKRKDLFVRNELGSRLGTRRFAAISGLRVVDTLQESQMRDDRVINFNRSGSSGTLQHALILRRGPLSSDVAGRAVGGPGLPKDIQEVLVRSGLNLSESVAFYRGSSRRTTSLGNDTIPHELSHASNVYHHGQGDVEQLFWTVRELNGRLLFYEGDKIVLLLDEAGNVQFPLVNQAFTHWMGVNQGQHSGDDRCIMRYDCSQLYRSRGDPLTYYSTFLSGGEPFGTLLCNSPAGKGVNLSGRSPQSRYGDAGAGCCQGQLCVNDSKGHAPNSTPTLRCGSGGDAPDDDTGDVVGDEPLLTVSVNDAREARQFRGRPLWIAVEVLHPAWALDPTGAPPVVLSSASGQWVRAVTLTVKSEAGVVQSWPLQPPADSPSTIALDGDVTGWVLFWLSLGDSANLAPGRYSVQATLDTTAAPQGWKGRVQSNPTWVDVVEEPAVLSHDESIEKQVDLIRHHFLLGESAPARSAAEALSAGAPESGVGHYLRAQVLSEAGDDAGALDAASSALGAFYQAQPAPEEPPAEFLQLQGTLTAKLLVSAGPTQFIRGDASGDGGLKLNDAVLVLGYLFTGGPGPACADAADANDDGQIDLGDPLRMLFAIFRGEGPLPAPGAACGADPTPDNLGCADPGTCPR
jgi:hypothetical protein